MEKPVSEAVTSELALKLCKLYASPLPDEVMDHAKHLFLNVLGLSIAASHDPATEKVIANSLLLGGAGDCRIPGRHERLRVEEAALAIGVAAHVDDFDDTHLATVIHPSAALLATLLPLASETGASGSEILRAFALGCEAQLRIGIAMNPWHYDAGWHITGTVGVIGSAVGAALLLGLDPADLAIAIGIAASSTVGLRESFGTMAKAWHVGKAAANGIFAARLAAAGFSAPSDVLESPRGFFDVLSTERRFEEVHTTLGEHWNLHDVVVKPYPCGIVAHPIIDAGREMREKVGKWEGLLRVSVECHPLVPDLMGNLDPSDGLEARFSAVHGFTVGALDEIVSLDSYSDRHVRDDAVSMFRSKVRLMPTPTCRRDEAIAEAEFFDGSRHRVYVPHARGSLERPLTHSELNQKVRDLVERRLPGVGDELITRVDQLDGATDINAILDLVSLGKESTQ